MEAYIRSYVQEFLENTNIECNINVTENLINVKMGFHLRRNIFLVIKE